MPSVLDTCDLNMRVFSYGVPFLIVSLSDWSTKEYDRLSSLMVSWNLMKEKNLTLKSPLPKRSFEFVFFL